MRVLCVHNHYQQRGGEDQIFADEVALLRRHGHEVTCYTRHNDDIPGMSRAELAVTTVWNRGAARDIRRLISAERPDVLHLYNTFPLISPVVARTGREAGVAVVQTVQNYRFVCANGELLRDGRVCRDCVSRTLIWPAVRHGCYRDDRAATAVVTLMLATHRLSRTWKQDVDRFIVPTAEVRRVLIEGGLQAEQLVVKPNFVDPDPGRGDGRGGYALFAGRLAPEKGVRTLLEAWRRLEGPHRLKIVGDGPLAEAVRRAAAGDPRIEWLGWQSWEAVMILLREAAVSVVPSIWYEAMPRTIVEAFAAGTPVIASDLGAMRAMIEPGVTGLHFAPGDAAELAAQVAWAFAHPPELAAMRLRARQEYERHYTAERGYARQLEIYQQAIEHADRRGKVRSALAASA